MMKRFFSLILLIGYFASESVLAKKSTEELLKLKIAYPFASLTSKGKKSTKAVLQQLQCPTNSDFQIPCCKQPPKNLSMTFDHFLLAVTIAPTNAEKDAIITSYIAEVCQKNNGWPLVEYCNGRTCDKSLVDFVYRPTTTDPIDEVLAAGEWNAFNGGSVFNPLPDNQNIVMNRISLGGEFPDLFYFRYSFENDARLDYKFVVDGNFIFDPLNPTATPGGFGGNSTLVMPQYCPQPGFKYHAHIPHGIVLGAGNVPLVPKTTSPIGGDSSIDPTNENKTLDPINPFIIPSSLLSPYVGGANLDQGYWVYLPAEYNAQPQKRYPVIYFLDGQDFLQFGNTNNILDYLIAQGCMEPAIAVFHRQDNCVTITNEPCQNGFFNAPLYEDPFFRDYNMGTIGTINTDGSIIQPFQDFLLNFLIPEIDARYRTIPCAKARVIVGDSATANQALFITLRHPEVFKKAIIQSLAFPNININLDLVDDFIQASIDQGTPPGQTAPQSYRHAALTTNEAMLDFLASFFPNAAGVSLYFNWGSYENPSRDNFNIVPMTLLNNEICPFLKERAKSVCCVEPHEDHSWGQWAKQVELALPKVLNGTSKLCKKEHCRNTKKNK